MESSRQSWTSSIASDAHNMHARKPELEPARLVAEKYIGEKEPSILVLVCEHTADNLEMHIGYT